MTFSHPCQTLSIDGRKYLAQLLNIIMRLITFSKKSSKCSFFYVGTVFTNMPSCFSESNFCGSKSENKVDFFGKKIFPRKVPPHTRNAILTTLPKKLDKNSKTFPSIFENNYVNKQFSQRTISWENVSSHIDCLPDSLAEKTSPEIWKVSCSKKSGRKIVYWDNFFLKMFPWTRRKPKRHSC